VNVHAPEAHTAVPFAGAVQTVQLVPHAVADVSLTHAPLQRWNPELHATPHAPAVHVAMLFARTGQGVQALPHVAGSLLLTHTEPHA
jgi:hypothetical protein